jgi:mannose-1-phosphate guanylyltransferase/mannose-1-phosphate guanylyltransferase/phosphomannomutase
VKAVVLCAGLGERLRPLTDETPKALIPVGGRPLLTWTLERLAQAGVKEVLINLHHLPQKIPDFVGDGSAYGLSVRYFFEEDLLGTAGALDPMRPFLPGPFYVVYGDVFLDDFPLEALPKLLRERGGIGVITVQRTDRPQDCDIVEVDSAGRVVAFHPAPGDFRYGDLGNAAVYFLSPRILTHLPEGAKWDFVRDLFPRALSAGETLWAYPSPVELFDIGTPERLARLRERLVG